MRTGKVKKIMSRQFVELGLEWRVKTRMKGSGSFYTGRYRSRQLLNICMKNSRRFIEIGC